MHTSSVSMKDTKEDVKCFKKLPFSASERELVVALVRERPIIEDKRIHASNIILKKQAWEALAVAFNAQPYVSQRTFVQLKRCWENIKSQRKKELTGGGPPQGEIEFVNTTTGSKKLEAEMYARKKRCTMNIRHEQALHELRIQREKILIERESNLLEYEKEIHELQKEKLKLEIDLLANRKS